VAQTEYATFGARFAAFLIDGVIIFVVAFVAMIGLGAAMSDSMSSREIGEFIDNVFTPLCLILAVLYFCLLESSSRMATLGKRALGLRVTDLKGRRIGFGRALGRTLGRFLSNFFFGLGYFAALWTPKKQTWHDSMAGTLVLKIK